MAKSFFSSSEQDQIVESIRMAEMNTSGEIRVHLEANCASDPYERATQLFGTLGMHQTELQNGILFYLAYQDKKFAIVGDKGIHQHVKQGFWDDLSLILSTRFKAGEFTIGLVEAISRCGDQLKHHFPYQSDDRNELSNEISTDGGSDA